MKRKSRRRAGKDDRLSKLPDELIHHIFHFIDTIYAVQASVLSKRWRYIWTSLPTLYFEHPRTEPKFSIDRKSFLNVVDKVVTLRDNEGHDIQNFYFDCKHKPHQPLTAHLGRWLLAAVRANVRDIDIDTLDSDCDNGDIETLDYDSDGYIIDHIPRFIFTCKTLRELRLKCKFNLPYSIHLPSLVHLELECISYEKVASISRLLLGCPNLEDLVVVLCYPRSTSTPRNVSERSKKIEIRSSKLKNLMICCVKRSSRRITLSVDAPNLVSLVSALHTKSVSVEYVSSIVSARIDTEFVRGYCSERRRSKAYPQCMFKCLKALHNATDLTLSSPLQGDTGVPEFLENLLPRFCNLRRLRLLQTRLSTDSIYMMASMLMCSPNIESLSLELTSIDSLPIWNQDSDSDLSGSESDSSDNYCYSSDPDSYSDLSESDLESDSCHYSFVNEIDIERLLSTFTGSNLKFVEIYNFQASDIELKFIELLLRKANILEKVSLIDKSKVRKKECVAIRQKFLDKVKMLPKASLTTTFHMESQ